MLSILAHGQLNQNLPSHCRSHPPSHPPSRSETDGYAPYDENAMLFMDYRTDYADKAGLSAEETKGLDETPTFLYAMPMGTAPNGRKKIFFEEVCRSVYTRRPATESELKVVLLWWIDA